MKKAIAFLFATLLFLTQTIQPAGGSPVGNSGLNPPIRAENVFFKQLYSTICLAVTIYKLDAVAGNPKDVIMRDHGESLSNPDIRFDLDRIDTGKKGWTRYYPVTVGGERYIVRVFLTEERAYQPQLPVLYEMVLREPAVTCQVLPDINSIIGSHRIRPLSVHRDTSAITSL